MSGFNNGLSAAEVAEAIMELRNESDCTFKDDKTEAEHEVLREEGYEQ